MDLIKQNLEILLSTFKKNNTKNYVGISFIKTELGFKLVYSDSCVQIIYDSDHKYKINRKFSFFGKNKTSKIIIQSPKLDIFSLSDNSIISMVYDSARDNLFVDLRNNNNHGDLFMKIVGMNMYSSMDDMDFKTTEQLLKQYRQLFKKEEQLLQVKKYK